MEVTLDIETDDLNPTRVWVIVCREIESNKVHIFREPDKNQEERKRFAEFVPIATRFIGHQIIKFDYLTVLCKFFPEITFDPRSFLDTLVCSRLFNFSVAGGHGLDAWGQRLGIAKPKVDDWSQGATDAIVHRCVEDTAINRALYLYLKRHIDHPSYQPAIELEHKMEFITWDMTRNGFGFDAVRARSIRDDIDNQLVKLDSEIQQSFPPRYKAIREVTPKLTAKGTISLVDFRWAEPDHDFSQYVAGASFTLVRPEPFNPASPSQVVARLNEAGWRPVNKTKGHIRTEQDLRRTRNKAERAELLARLEEYKETGWKVDEENLDTLPEDAPEGARKLAQRLVLASRRSVITEWLNAYNEATGSIHGQFQSIGAWTQRMSHSRPNQGNIPTHPDVKDPKNPTPVEQWKIKYSTVLRECFIARPKRRLVGVDADGIQLRILAHYMDDPDFTEALVNGDKKRGTDAHTLNGVKLGLISDISQIALNTVFRDRAKTFIYAWLLGAGLDKVAEILHTSTKDAKQAVENFIKGYPGLAKLKQSQIPADAKRGFFIGLDGRLVPVENEHKVLAGYLQNGEQMIMKKAAIIWRAKLKKENFPFWMVDFVHDEFQTETLDDDAHASYLIQNQIEAIVQAGVELKLKCPLAGEGKQGYNWAQTH